MRTKDAQNSLKTMLYFKTIVSVVIEEKSN